MFGIASENRWNQRKEQWAKMQRRTWAKKGRNQPYRRDSSGPCQDGSIEDAFMCCSTHDVENEIEQYHMMTMSEVRQSGTPNERIALVSLKGAPY